MDKFVIKTTRTTRPTKKGHTSAYAASTSTKVIKKGYPSAYAASTSTAAYEARKAGRKSQKGNVTGTDSAGSSSASTSTSKGLAAIVEQWEHAQKVMEAPDELDEPDIEANDMEVHACAYKPDYLESINDKKRWVRNNCEWIKQLMKVIEEGVNAIDDPKPLDAMLLRINMVKNDVQHIQKEFTPVSIQDLDKAMCPSK